MRVVPAAVWTATGTASANGSPPWLWVSEPVTTQPSASCRTAVTSTPSAGAPGRVTHCSKNPPSSSPLTASKVARRSPNEARLPRKSR